MFLGRHIPVFSLFKKTSKVLYFSDVFGIFFEGIMLIMSTMMTVA